MSKEEKMSPDYSIVRRDTEHGEGENVGRIQAKESNHSVVVAIDFGTTYRQAVIIVIILWSWSMTSPPARQAGFTWSVGARAKVQLGTSLFCCVLNGNIFVHVMI